MGLFALLLHGPIDLKSFSKVISNYLQDATFSSTPDGATPSKRQKCDRSKSSTRLTKVEDNEDLECLGHKIQNIFEGDKSETVNAKIVQINKEKHALVLHHASSDHGEEYLEMIADTILAQYFFKLNRGVFAKQCSAREFTECRALPKGTEREERNTFWKSILDAANFDLMFRRDFNEQSGESRMTLRKIKKISLSHETQSKIQMTCEDHGISMSTFLTTVFSVLLSRYSGQNDICFSFTTDDSECLQTVSPLTPFKCPLTACIRMQFTNDLSFKKLTATLNQSVTEAFVNYLPCEEVIHLLKTKHKRMPATGLRYYKETLSAIDEQSRIEVAKLDFSSSHRKPHLTFRFAESTSGIHAAIEYKSYVFQEDTIRRIVDSFEMLLESSISNIHEEIGSLLILSAHEMELYQKWNCKNEFVFDTNVRIHDIIDKTCKQYPERIALVQNCKRLTYRELNYQANQLAAHLQKELRLGPEILIGICLDKSIEMIVTLLAVLKTGAAYLPLDPSHPPERLYQLIKEAQPLTILVQSAYQHLFSGNKIIFGQYPATFSGVADDIILPETKAASLAYILYTSGTTGTPKGILTQHSNVVAFVEGLKRCFKLEDDGILLAASYNFCLFHALLFFILCTGSKGILAPTILHVPHIEAREEITYISSPPAGLRQLVKDNEIPKSTHTIILGGDIVPEQLVEDIYNLPCTTKRRIFVSHGSTEVTLFDTIEYVERGKTSDFGIGRPFPNQRAYIVDRNMQRVPIGVVGELCTSGPQVSRGYLHSTKSQNFVENLFLCETMAVNEAFYKTLYKSGDLCYWKADGTIEFVGRIDFQVKIRGVRIELDEISHTLLRHASVKEAVAVTRTLSHGKQGIVTYIALHKKNAPIDVNFRTYLQSCLPSYMIPDHYVLLDILPRNINGKIDRQALPDPKIIFPTASSETIPQRSIDEKIVGLVRKILGNDAISISDNFINLGMDSAEANYLTVVLMKEFNIDLQVQSLHENPTTLKLSSFINSAILGKEELDEFDPDAESQFDSHLIETSTISAHSWVDGPKNVLLTGATGFLGAFLLYELTRQTTADIHCLTRACDKCEGYDRIRKNLQYYRLWNDDMSRKIHCVAGDYTKPYLGLCPDEFAKLSTKIDFIYHSGGHVNFLLPYTALRTNDIVGIKVLLNFASHLKTKRFHHVSSVAAHASTYSNENCLIKENDDIDHNRFQLPTMGYVRAKWVSEKLVWSASNHGLPVKVFRPSFIIGATESGAMSTREFVAKFIKGCIQLKAFPEKILVLNTVPVDYVASAIIHISLQVEESGQAYHLTASTGSKFNTKKIFSSVRDFGFEVAPLDYEKWSMRLQQEMSSKCDNELMPLFHFVLDFVKNTHKRLPKYDKTETDKALADSNIHCSALTKISIEKMLNFFVETGFLQKEWIKNK